MIAYIKSIAYYLPLNGVTNDELAAQYPGWTADKIYKKTGIQTRRIAAPEQCASDLGVEAAQALFRDAAVQPSDIDFLLFCTQSPDYLLPTTACMVQDRLGIPRHAGALDFNLGCSGYVYGLGLAKGLIETGQAANVLLITAETYSKFLAPADHQVRTIFGDAASATLVSGRTAVEGTGDDIGPFVYGTDGRGAENLIVRHSGLRGTQDRTAASGQPDLRLTMNGPEIFSFTLREIPQCVQGLLGRAGRTLDEIDLFVFHQANSYMLEHLRDKLGVPTDRFVVDMTDCGNTVSSTIPIALSRAAQTGRLRSGHLVALVGFGVGYSWGATLVRWGRGDGGR